DVDAEKDRLVLEAPERIRLECVAFSRDGRWVAAGGQEEAVYNGPATSAPRAIRRGLVLVWDADSGRQVQRLAPEPQLQDQDVSRPKEKKLARWQDTVHHL